MASIEVSILEEAYQGVGLMDLLPTKWFSEMESDDYDDFIIHQWQHMSSLEDSVDSFDYCETFPSNNISNSSSTLKSEPQVSQISVDKYTKEFDEQKHWKLCTCEKASPSSTIISFANLDLPRSSEADNKYENAKFYVNLEMEPLQTIMSLESIYSSSSVSQVPLENPCGPFKFAYSERKVAIRNPAQAREHVLAERMRRERMTQRFISLAAVIPSLKKLDKATVLGDATKYIKVLQERVRKLEEEVKRNNKESAVSVKRLRLSDYDNNGYSSDENLYSSSKKSLPEIEVSASERSVLVQLYCRNHTGIIEEILSEIERHHLTMVSSSIMPFGDNRLHLTITAQMADQHKITAKTLVDNLQAIANLI